MASIELSALILRLNLKKRLLKKEITVNWQSIVACYISALIYSKMVTHPGIILLNMVINNLTLETITLWKNKRIISLITMILITVTVAIFNSPITTLIIILLSARMHRKETENLLLE